MILRLGICYACFCNDNYQGHMIDDFLTSLLWLLTSDSMASPPGFYSSLGGVMWAPAHPPFGGPLYLLHSLQRRHFPGVAASASPATGRQTNHVCQVLQTGSTDHVVCVWGGGVLRHPGLWPMLWSMDVVPLSCRSVLLC